MGRNSMMIVSILALSGMSYAGGSIAPVAVVEEPVVVAAPMIVNENTFYVGFGYSNMKLNNDLTDEEFDANALMLQVGYQYNQYLAIEGRYTFSVGDVDYTHGNTINPNYNDYPTDFTNLAIYLKPMYSMENFSVYALLGYGEVALTNIPLGGVGISADRGESGFQWGLGAQYTFTDNVSIFVDYVQMYDDTGFDGRAVDADMLADAWTLGVSYKF